MTVEHFLMLLAGFSIITSLFTEAIKKIASDTKNIATNIIVLVLSILVGGCGMTFYYILTGCSFDVKGIIIIFLMICANWLCSMLGYDKVIQSIKQIGVK